ncbi:MAG TPA: hypothetical protein VGX25_07495 [Actinophytocola sp.]|uniref:hypothetical protein n=1 Tax=Actinophytocola sp. TaxID=1872138 RepID=UPI002DDC9B8F|nr:hypothetical protein [Actinophytocola sp.]HEV2779230.1 hypothetical protein [Actinophytocola sp.]
MLATGGEQHVLTTALLDDQRLADEPLGDLIEGIELFLHAGLLTSEPPGRAQLRSGFMDQVGRDVEQVGDRISRFQLHPAGDGTEPPAVRLDSRAVRVRSTCRDYLKMFGR